MNRNSYRNRCASNVLGLLQFSAFVAPEFLVGTHGHHFGTLIMIDARARCTQHFRTSVLMAEPTKHVVRFLRKTKRKKKNVSQSVSMRKRAKKRNHRLPFRRHRGAFQPMPFDRSFQSLHRFHLRRRCKCSCHHFRCPLRKCFDGVLPRNFVVLPQIRDSKFAILDRPVRSTN